MESVVTIIPGQLKKSNQTWPDKGRIGIKPKTGWDTKAPGSQHGFSTASTGAPDKNHESQCACQEGPGSLEPVGISRVAEGDAVGRRERAQVPATPRICGRGGF
jgi:hypothetical protein